MHLQTEGTKDKKEGSNNSARTNLDKASPSDMIRMHMCVHGIHKLQPQLLNDRQVPVYCPINWVNQLKFQ